MFPFIVCTERQKKSLYRLGAETAELSDFSILPEGQLPGGVFPGVSSLVRSDLFLVSDEYFVKKEEIKEIENHEEMSLLRNQHFQNKEIEHMAFYLASKVIFDNGCMRFTMSMLPCCQVKAEKGSHKGMQMDRSLCNLLKMARDGAYFVSDNAECSIDVDKLYKDVYKLLPPGCMAANAIQFSDDRKERLALR